MPESNDVGDSLRRLLGLPQSWPSDDEPPRPVDKRLLRQLHTVGIADDLLHWEISSLVARYRVWAQAEKEVLYELLREEIDTHEVEADPAAAIVEMDSVPDSLITSSVQNLWLIDNLDWQELQPQNAVARALFVASVLCSRLAMRPIRAMRESGRESAEDVPSVLKELECNLNERRPATLAGEGRWVHLAVKGDVVQMRAGASAADRFRDFRVEFRHGEDVLVILESVQGVVEIHPKDFQIVHQRADRLVILA